MFMTLTGEQSWQRLRRSPVDVLKKRKNRSLSHPLEHLGVTCALHLCLVGKPVVDFIFVVIELFSLSPTVETLWAENGQSRRFSKGVGHFERRFQRERASPTNHCWYQSSRVIAISCGIKISAVRHLVLSQCTRVTDRQTDGQNYDSQDRPRICLGGKKSKKAGQHQNIKPSFGRPKEKLLCV